MSGSKSDDYAGPPRLLDFTCETITKDERSVCVLNLELESKSMPATTKEVSVELSASTMDTLLDGLQRIKNQLSSLANK